MEKFRPIMFSEEYSQKYWEGSSNKFARFYTYLQRGFGLFNETKNYILMLFGAYWTIKTADFWLGFGVSDAWLIVGLLIVTVIGVGLLLLAGRWDLYKLSKAREYVNAKEGTITRFNGYNMSVLNVSLMEAIAQRLGVDVEELKRGLEENNKGDVSKPVS